MNEQDALIVEGEEYRQRRVALAIPAYLLAKRAGLTHRVVLKLEKGERITPESKRRIDQALRERAEELAAIAKQELSDETPAA